MNEDTAKQELQDRLNLSGEMWPIVALHEELEQRGAFG